MNAPCFNHKNLTAPFRTIPWWEQFIAEEKRVCGPIDARIDIISKEFCALTDQISKAEELLENTGGFFAFLALEFKIKNLKRQRAWREKVLYELYDARNARTITW